MRGQRSSRSTGELVAELRFPDSVHHNQSKAVDVLLGDPFEFERLLQRGDKSRQASETEFHQQQILSRHARRADGPFNLTNVATRDSLFLTDLLPGPENLAVADFRHLASRLTHLHLTVEPQSQVCALQVGSLHSELVPAQGDRFHQFGPDGFVRNEPFASAFEDLRRLVKWLNRPGDRQWPQLVVTRFVRRNGFEWRGRLKGRVTFDRRIRARNQVPIRSV